MRYVIRADASLQAGSGHVMRSSALAEELLGRGCEVIFIGVVTGLPWVYQRILNLGFSRILLSESEFFPNPSSDVLILDSYTLSITDPFLQESNWKKIICIADDATPLYRCDLVFHPGIETQWQGGFSATVLSGPKFVPFRASIKRNNKILKQGESPEILIVGGGADAFGFVSAIGKTLQNLELNFQANLISDQINAFEFDSRFRVLPPGEILDQLALSTDLVFTTASTTCLEFIARDIAVGIGCAVENQEQYYNSLPKHSLAAPIGKYLTGGWVINETLIAKLIKSEKMRKVLRSKAANLIDLNGAKRIIDEIQLL